MDNEPYETLTHHKAADLIAAELRRIDWRAEREFVLPDGRVADVFCRTDDGDFAIIEVKAELKASLLSDACRKYGRWSNLLWLAVPDLVYGKVEHAETSPTWRDQRDAIGILGVYHGGLAAYRSPHMRAMHGNNYERVRDLLALR